MFLEVAAVVGAVAGALLATHLDASAIAVIFGGVRAVSSYFSFKRREEAEPERTSHPWALRLGLEGSYRTNAGPRHYHVQRVPAGAGLMALAGALSGLLGIGAGAVKALAMDQAMRLPYKVSTATSNFVIGITAAASAGVYFTRGYVDPGLTMPVMLGVLLGALTGARVMVGTTGRGLRVFFSIVILVLAAEMIYQGLRGGL